MAVTYTTDWDGVVAYTQFAWDVSMDGDIVVNGHRNSTVDAVSSCGSVRVYTWNGSTWDYDLLVASDKATGDHNGHRVDISGDYIISGAPDGDAAYIYKNDAGTWSQEKILSESGGSYGDSVAIDDNGAGRITAVVGAPNTTNGTVYWYEEDEGGAGTWGQLDSISGASSGDNYGFDVDIAGATTVVGSQGPDAAYVVTWSGSAWAADETLTSSTQTYEFGWAVSISPDETFIAVGDPASWSTNAGIAIFSESGGSWSEDGVVVADNEHSNQQFGKSVACSNTHVIGGTNEVGANPGTAQISLLSDRSLVENFGADGGGTNGYTFGWRVYVQDGGAGADRFLVSEVTNDDSFEDGGKLWLIDLPSGDATVDLVSAPSKVGIGTLALTPGGVSVALVSAPAKAGIGALAVDGAASIALASAASKVGIGTLAVTAGDVSVALVGAGSKVGIGALVQTPGDVVVSLAGAGAKAGIGALAVTAGGVAVALEGAGSKVGIGALEVTPGDSTSLLESAPSKAGIGSLALSAGDVSVALEGLGAKASIGALEVAPGDSTSLLESAPSKAGIGALVVVAGAVVCSLGGLGAKVGAGTLAVESASTSDLEPMVAKVGIGALTLAPGSVAVALASAPSKVGIGALTLDTGGDTVSLEPVAAKVGIGTLAVSPGAVSTALAGAPAKVGIGTLALVPGDVVVSLDGLGSKVGAGALALTPGGVSVALAGLGAKTSIGALGLAVGAVTTILESVAAKVGLGTLALAPGDVVIDLEGLGAKVGIGALVLTPGAVVIDLEGLGAKVGIGPLNATVAAITAISAAVMRPNTVGAVLTGTDFGSSGSAWLGDGSDFGTAELVQLGTSAWADTEITCDLSHGVGEGTRYLFVETPAGVSPAASVVVSHPHLRWVPKRYTVGASTGVQSLVDDLDPDYPPVLCLAHWNGGKSGSSVSACIGHGALDQHGNQAYTVVWIEDGASLRTGAGGRRQGTDHFIRVHSDSSTPTCTIVDAELTAVGIDADVTLADAGVEVDLLFLCGRTADAWVGLPAVDADALAGASFPGVATGAFFSSVCRATGGDSSGMWSVGWTDFTNSWCTAGNVEGAGTAGALSKTWDDAVATQYAENVRDWRMHSPIAKADGCWWTSASPSGSDVVLVATFWLDGCPFEVGVVQKPTGTAPIAHSIPSSFPATGLILSTGGKSNQSVTTEEGYGNCSYGFAKTPEVQAHGFVNDRDQPTVVSKEMFSGLCCSVGEDGASVFQAKFIGFKFASAELEWITNNSEAVYVGYVFTKDSSSQRR